MKIIIFFLVFCCVFVITRTKTSDNCVQKHCDGFLNDDCQCRNLIVMVVCFTYWCTVIICALLSQLYFSSNKSQITLYSFAMSSHRTAKYMYQVIIRINYPENAINLKNTSIDIELLDQDRQQIAPGVRFSANMINSPFSHVQLIIGRFTDMPRIAKIRCSHTGHKDTKFFISFFNVHVAKTPQKNQLFQVQYYLVNNYIVKDIKELNAELKHPDEIDEEIIPLGTLVFTYLEIIAFISIVVSGCAVISFYLPKVCTIIVDYNISDALMSFLYSLFVNGIAFLIVISLYRWSLQMEYKSKSVDSDKSSGKCYLFRIFLLIAPNLLTLIMSYDMAIRGFKHSYYGSALWLSSTGCTSGIIIALWTAYYEKDKLFRWLKNKIGIKDKRKYGKSSDRSFDNSIDTIGSSQCESKTSTISSDLGQCSATP